MGEKNKPGLKWARPFPQRSFTVFIPEICTWFLFPVKTYKTHAQLILSVFYTLHMNRAGTGTSLHQLSQTSLPRLTISQLGTIRAAASGQVRRPFHCCLLLRHCDNPDARLFHPDGSSLGHSEDTYLYNLVYTYQ